MSGMFAGARTYVGNSKEVMLGQGVGEDKIMGTGSSVGVFGWSRGGWAVLWGQGLVGLWGDCVSGVGRSGG